MPGECRDIETQGDDTALDDTMALDRAIVGSLMCHRCVRTTGPYHTGDVIQDMEYSPTLVSKAVPDLGFTG